MTDRDQDKSFEEAGQEAEQGLVGEFFSFMKENAAWWLVPFLVVFGLLGLLLVLGGTGAAPFLYAMF
jgi:hypothetical protein